MSNTSNKILSTLKEFYSEINNQLMAGKKGIDQFLFGTDNRSMAAEFNIDRLIVAPHGIAFRHPDTQSVVREYQPGKGIFYDIPHASEKTPISESLKDSIVAGGSQTGFAENNARLISDIVTQHSVAHVTTRWKYAIDTLRTGKFTPLGQQGKDIGLEIDFKRDGSLDVTYNFTAADATIDKALGALIDAYRAKGGNPQNVCVIMGEDWLSTLEEDTDVMERMKANAANVILQMNMMPPELQNTQGLYLVGQYRVPGKLFPIWICGYSPQDQFTPYKGASAESFFPSDEAVIFSIGEKRYRVFGGIDALSDSGKAVRLAGAEIIFDTFNSSDPVTEYIRSQTRLCFVPGNVDHTARSTGTFAAS